MSKEELSYILITAHSLSKSRTGGIISRAISRTGLDLVAARMFAPSKELTEKFANDIPVSSDPRHRATEELLRDYVLEKFTSESDREPQRVMILVFRGEDAAQKICDVVGHIVNQRTVGRTIRDTYGDYVTDDDGAINYFEPAVLAPPDATTAERDLKLWAAYSDADGGILPDLTESKDDGEVQTTLVLIKPDNFTFPNRRPGGVIDIFSRTGLGIVGIKVHHMSVAEGEKFYGPVLDVLQDIFRAPAATRARLAIEQEFGFPLNNATQTELGETIGRIHGQHHWETIVQFMTGNRPSECSDAQKLEPGTRKCVALIYQGVDAVAKIRQALGPTDPSKAPHGSIRREFGESIMINAAHASDSPDNVLREMGIINAEENNFKPLVENFYQTK